MAARFAGSDRTQGDLLTGWCRCSRPAKLTRAKITAAQASAGMPGAGVPAVAAKRLLRSGRLCGLRAGELRGEQSRAELRGEQSRACLHSGEGGTGALPLSPSLVWTALPFPSRRLGRAPMRLAPTATPAKQSAEPHNWLELLCESPAPHLMMSGGLHTTLLHRKRAAFRSLHREPHSR